MRRTCEHDTSSACSLTHFSPQVTSTPLCGVLRKSRISASTERGLSCFLVQAFFSKYLASRGTNSHRCQAADNQRPQSKSLKENGGWSTKGPLLKRELIDPLRSLAFRSLCARLASRFSSTKSRHFDPFQLIHWQLSSTCRSQRTNCISLLASGLETIAAHYHYYSRSSLQVHRTLHTVL